jgi:hypothetical protein
LDALLRIAINIEFAHHPRFRAGKLLDRHSDSLAVPCLFAWNHLEPSSLKKQH